MRRREFITLLGSTAAAPVIVPFAVRAQQRRARIAVLSINSSQDDGKVLAAFVDGLRVLGHVEGRTVDIDYRYVDGDTPRLIPQARELIALKPDLALATSLSPVNAVKGVAPDLPIVCPSLSESAVPTLAESYARPGGSVTGLASSVEGMYVKLVELALDIIPSLARIGFPRQSRRRVDAAVCAAGRDRRTRA